MTAIQRAIATVNSAGKRTILNEALESARFRLAWSARREARQRYLACREPADFLVFAEEIFPGPFSQFPEEILAFLDYARHRAPVRVSEIGTQFGGTNFLLTQALPSITMMVGVDLLVRNRARLLTFRRPGQQISLLNGDSHDEATFRRVAAALGGEKLDLLFIDGDHRWAGVVRDFLLYRDLVAPGGLIAFHDIVPDNRLRGKPARAAYSGEVPILWDRLKRHYAHREFVRDWEQEGLGIGVLEHDPSVVVPEEVYVG